jgi:hypothetical protein
MGFGKRIVRQSVRAATPRTVRKATHPVRTAKTAVTPDAILKAKLVAIDLANPVGAVENAAIRAVLKAPKRATTASRKANKSQRSAGSNGSQSFDASDYPYDDELDQIHALADRTPSLRQG